MVRNYILVVILTVIFIFSVQISLSQYTELTPVPDEFLEKEILYAGECLKSIMGKDYKSYRLYPMYDIHGQIISYEGFFYFGEGDMPTDKELLEVAHKLFKGDITRKSKEETKSIYESYSLLNNTCIVNISSCYELSPYSILIIGTAIPSYFKKYVIIKEILENSGEFLQVSFDDYKGILRIPGYKDFVRFILDDEEIFIHAYPPYDIYTREELLNEINNIEKNNKFWDNELKKENWQKMEMKFDDLE